MGSDRALDFLSFSLLSRRTLRSTTPILATRVMKKTRVVYNYVLQVFGLIPTNDR